MPNLKNLKIRIKSITSTRKITKAMKVVSASKLKKAQNAIKDSSIYYNKINLLTKHMLLDPDNQSNKFLFENEKDQNYLFIVISSDKGLCGPFNSNVYKCVKKEINALRAIGKSVQLFTIGNKVYSLLNQYRDLIIKNIEIDGKNKITYSRAQDITTEVIEMFNESKFDKCKVFFNYFESTMLQKVVSKNIIPYIEKDETPLDHFTDEYEPDKTNVISEIIPLAIAAKLYHALLNSLTSEHAARMTAMDNANRNAEEMIGNLRLLYNRTRQAIITKELIEVISGAEAL